MITEEQVKQYHQEGYTIVENVFGDNELDPVLNEFEEIVNDLAERAFPVSYTHLTLPTTVIV